MGIRDSRRGKILTPTDKGITLIQVLPSALSSPETTGRWEKELAEIGRGEADPEAFMEGIRRLVVDLVRESAQKNTEVSFPQETRTHDPSAPKVSLGKCPLCESDVRENSKAYYCSQWRSGCRDVYKRQGWGCPRNGNPDHFGRSKLRSPDGC